MQPRDFCPSFTASARLGRYARRQTGCILRFAALAILGAAALSGQSALSILNTSPLPVGTVGVQYAVALSVSGGTAPYTWSYTGSLPPGLSLVPSQSLIIGTPTTAGNYQFTLTVVDQNNVSVSKVFNLPINTSGGGSSLSISTTSLPAATVGQSYSQQVSATGGTTPYTWSATGLPAGLAINSSTGVIAGTPTAAGSFTVTVQVTDSNSSRNTATHSFPLTVNGTTLQITNPISPLFNGTAGSAYTATTFTAQGGTPPYTWAIVSGNADGLTMTAAGVLSGTPQSAGSFTFGVQVQDSVGATASKNYSFTANPPSLVITAFSFPAGTVNVPYNQTAPAAAVSGGAPPYTWSLASGSVPGLTFVPASVSFTGTPTTPGTFPITLQAADSSTPQLTATKSLSVTIAPAALSIATPLKLPAATLNIPYNQTMTAAGGTPPYTWSANGLPAGLSINSATGVISGVPTAASTAPFVVVTVIDSALKSAQNNFTLTVNLPPAPAITVSGLPDTANAAGQYPVQITLSAGYTAAITGQLIIGFQANSGLGDSTIQFSTGGTTAGFNIPAGSTSATFVDSNGIAVSQLQIQTGTVAGTISLSVSNLRAGGVDITPTPAPGASTQVAAAAPVITNVLVTSDGNNGCPKGQICLQVTGYATSREVTQAVYAFAAASGQTLQSSSGSITVDVSSVFSNWFSASAIGSQFILSQPFTVQGSPSGVIPQSVTLSNRVGSTTASISQK